MNPKIVTTQMHRITPGHYMRLVAEEWLSRWWWAVLIPIVACAAYGILVNPLWIVVALILVFIIMPMLQLWFFYNYSLTAEAAAAMRWHVVEVFADGSIGLEFEPDAETGRQFAPILVPNQQIANTEFRADELVITLTGRPIRLIIIPLEENYSESLQEIYTTYIA